jgi:hypothetical protein
VRQIVKKVLFTEIYEQNDLDIIEALKKHYHCNGAEMNRRVLRSHYVKIFQDIKKRLKNAT